jgi:hypothetical protein
VCQIYRLNKHKRCLLANFNKKAIWSFDLTFLCFKPGQHGGLRSTDRGEKPAMIGIQGRHSEPQSDPKLPKGCGTLTPFDP